MITLKEIIFTQVLFWVLAKLQIALYSVLVNLSIYITKFMKDIFNQRKVVEIFIISCNI